MPGTAGLTYPGLGGTRTGAVPPGFARLTRSTKAGNGRLAFERVADALMDWDIHRRAGLLVESEGPVAEGALVRLSLPGPARLLPLMIECRVVYVIDEPGRRGFGYGTLPGHPEEGEARFLVDFDEGRDPQVFFTVNAFSRPGPRWARLLAPAVRVVQEATTQGYLRAARRFAAG